MALIICPECKCEISDKVKNCVHCGYPISKYKLQNYKINHIEVDLSFILNENISKRDKIKKVQDLTGYGLKDSMNIVHDIYEEYDIQDSMDMQANITEIMDDKIKCPYCNSTDVKKISSLSKAGSVALWGIFAAGKVSKNFHCNKCKADF